MSGPPQNLTEGDRLQLVYDPRYADPPLDLDVLVSNVVRDSEGIQSFDATAEPHGCWTVFRSEWEKGLVRVL